MAQLRETGLCIPPLPILSCYAALKLIYYMEYTNCLNKPLAVQYGKTLFEIDF